MERDRTGDRAPEPVRLAGLPPGGVGSRTCRRESPVQLHPALRAADERGLVEDELATDQALERRSAQNGEELLLERPVE